MAQCDLSYSPCKGEERLCRFGYTTNTWCPNCDKDSPRKRSKSETVDEPCRRRFRDNKKYDWKNPECENMEHELDCKDFASDSVRWDRVRSNLCELPTTYISNNCLKVSNQDYSDSTEKSFKTSSEACPNFGNIMVERHDKLSKLLPKIDESTRNINGIVSKMKQIDAKKLKPGMTIEPHFSSSNFKSSPFNLHLDEFDRPNIKEATFPDVADHSSVFYDTCSFFDKKIDVSNLREQYSQEVEVLKVKLKYLKQNGLEKPTPLPKKYISPIVNQHILRTNVESNDVLKKMDIKDVVKLLNNHSEDEPKELPAITSVSVESLSECKQKPKGSINVSKIALKTKPKSTLKFRKPRIKSVVTNSELSDSGDEFTDAEESSKDLHESDSLDDLSTSSSGKDISLGVSGSGDSFHWPLRQSLFPHIPPYLLFIAHDAPSPQKYPAGTRHLKWKLSTITPILIRKVLVNSGIRLVRSEFTRESNEWVGTWGKHMKSPMFQTMKDSQKLNHFPGTFQLGRKDRLWRNFQKLISRYGFKEFGFTPQTYVLPQDLKLLKQHWQSKDTGTDQKYIIKPPASARGTGIKVINRWCQLPKRMSLVVQEYISNPFLINNSKFDLRLYVLVTSFNPLRVYLYPEGLARFASVPYSDDPKDLRDRFMHLTNYSINKLSLGYTANEDANACKGHKWTLTKLWEYMSKRGINTKALWKTLQQLVIKTMISGESSISTLCRGNLISRYNCYELFGVDVLIDEYLKCWLLEVNISPSLHSQSPLDEHVKGPLVKSLFNLVQFHLPPKMKRTETIGIPPCYDPRLYTIALTRKEINKHNYFGQVESRRDYLDEILANLTGDDVRHLTQAEDEFAVIGDFQRIFPTSQTHKYFEYMGGRYYNKLFDAWEHKYEQNREPGINLLRSLCEQKVHLKVATPAVTAKNSQNSIPGVEKPLPAMENLTPSVGQVAVTVPTIVAEDTKHEDCSTDMIKTPSGMAAHNISMFAPPNNIVV